MQEVDAERDPDGGDRAPRDREDEQAARLGLPAVDEPHGQQHADERDERQQHPDDRRGRADRVEEVADERDEDEHEDADDPDRRGAAPPRLHRDARPATSRRGGIDAPDRDARLRERRRERRGRQRRPAAVRASDGPGSCVMRTA